MLQKIVSGAQTGVDRAALDVALLLELEYGGWCPRGRLDEKGKIPDNYKKLKEVSGEYKTDKENYDARTRQNIQDSDATLIIIPKCPLPQTIKDGTVLTMQEAKKNGKPLLIIDLSKSISANAEHISEWVKGYEILTLNIAGPRESTCPGIYNASFELLQQALPGCKKCCSPRP